MKDEYHYLSSCRLPNKFQLVKWTWTRLLTTSLNLEKSKMKNCASTGTVNHILTCIVHMRRWKEVYQFTSCFRRWIISLIMISYTKGINSWPIIIQARALSLYRKSPIVNSMSQVKNNHTRYTICHVPKLKILYFENLEIHLISGKNIRLNRSRAI